MAQILDFPRQGRGNHRAQVDDSPARLLSALDEVGRTLSDLLLGLLAELEDSSLRLSLVIERSLVESEKRVLRAEQQELRATIAELRQAIGTRRRPSSAPDADVSR